MAELRKKTKIKYQADLATQLNEVVRRSAVAHSKGSLPATKTPANRRPIKSKKVLTEKKAYKSDPTHDSLFDRWDEDGFVPQDFETPVYIDSLESAVGYSSLVRQLQHSYIERVAFYRSRVGGSLSIEDARKEAFRESLNEEEAKELFSQLMSSPAESLSFVSLAELRAVAPRVAEQLWEHLKREGRSEFESGHAAANAAFPVHYLRSAWNIARYLGLRESFIDDWNPTGGMEIALVDMLAQSYFQWQYWLEQSVKRSITPPYEEHPDYREWKSRRAVENRHIGLNEGYWFQPRVSDERAVENAVQMADRWHRMFMRTLRQLRDLRRYAPVTINNPNQVNIASDGGQQVNVSE